MDTNWFPMKNDDFDSGQALSDMKRVWKAFIQEKTIPKKELRPDILSSWRRCLSLNVNPDNHKPAFLRSDQLNDRLYHHQECIEALDLVIDSVNDFIDVSNHVVGFVDPEGYVLKIFGSKDIQDILASVNFTLGANWNERFTGTTAVGIALKTGQPSHVFHAEHYCRRLHEFTCTAVPIRDPFTNKMLGVLDFVAYVRDHQPHSQGMALQMGRCIELEIYRSRKERDDFFRDYSTQLTLDQMERGVILLDDKDQIHRANLKTLELLGIESDDLLNKRLHSLAILQGWEDKNKPFYIHTRGQTVVRLARQPLVHQRRFIGSLILVEKSHTGQKSPSSKESTHEPIGNSPSFLEVMEFVEKASKFDSNVLIIGKTGTGKEVIARNIHERSHRAGKPFVAINCGSIPPNLLGSELFGYESGAFTGADRNGHISKLELSNGGTLLLDEISEMPLESQVYLLRVIEERTVTRLGGTKAIPVDIRVIASSNKDLQDEVESGRFRADLFFRLNVLHIELPTLKERKGDIPLLAKHFLESLSARLSKNIKGVSDEALSALIAYDWPGNIREFRNVIEQAIVMAEGPLIGINDIASNIQRAIKIPLNIPEKEKQRYLAFLKAYSQADGNVSKISRILSISRPTVYAWQKKFGIS